MFPNRIVALCAGLSLIATNAWAQNVGPGFEPEPDQTTTRVGTRGAAFLELPVGARAQALAGAGAAIVTGVEALAWNVAAAAEVEELSVGYSFSTLYGDADISHQFVGAVLPLGDVSVLGLSVVSLTSGDMVRTSELFPDGGDPLFGATFEFSGFAASLAYSRRITDRLNLGVAGKIVSEGIDNARANWLGVDVGVLFRTGLMGVTLGAAIVNLGGESRFEGSAIERQVAANQDVFETEVPISVRFDTEELALPTAFRFSALFQVTGTAESLLPDIPAEHRVQVAMGLYDSISSNLEPSIGVEYSWRDYFFLRGGKSYLNEGRAGHFRDFMDGLSFGGGLRLPVLDRHLGFDYAYTDMGVLENVQTVSLYFGL